MFGVLTRRGLMRRVDAARVEAALAAAEKQTSGEIRVSVAPFFWGSVEHAASLAFERLGMTDTRDRNGVLIFVVPSRHRFRLLGDEGIHAKVGQAFWDEVAAHMSEHFHAGDYTRGLVEGIAAIGRGLAEHFPHAGDADVNELPDHIDFGQ
jgi:uncharacterized membrane protein